MVPITHTPILEPIDSPPSPRETLPTMYDLPSENPEDPGLPDVFHNLQPYLLSRTLQLSAYPRNNWFAASRLYLYYDVNRPFLQISPDWFLAVDVPLLYDGTELRLSYVVWQEGKSPDMAIEFLSPGTEVEDLGRFYGEAVEQSASQPPAKLEVYERYLQIPHYLVYSRYTQELRYFQLAGGQYQEQALNAVNPIVWLANLEIGLGIWDGVFEGIPGYWLRWCDREGNWLLTDTEQAELQAEQERSAKEQEQSAKEQAQTQLLQAARNLSATGMDIAQVAQLLELSAAQVQALQSF